MELEALRSIYEGDECFKEISPVSFQFRVSITVFTVYFLEKTGKHASLLLYLSQDKYICKQFWQMTFEHIVSLSSPYFTVCTTGRRPGGR